jgi:hypothetical protein
MSLEQTNQSKQRLISSVFLDHASRPVNIAAATPGIAKAIQIHWQFQKNGDNGQEITSTRIDGDSIGGGCQMSCNAPEHVNGESRMIAQNGDLSEIPQQNKKTGNLLFSLSRALKAEKPHCFRPLPHRVLGMNR